MLMSLRGVLAEEVNAAMDVSIMKQIAVCNLLTESGFWVVAALSR
jgi:hypothetical protein